MYCIVYEPRTQTLRFTLPLPTSPSLLRSPAGAVLRCDIVLDQQNSANNNKQQHVAIISFKRNMRNKLRLVAFNDVYELTNLPKIQTFLSKLGSSGSSPSAVILAGDFLSPSTLSALDGGKGMVATLRAIGVTHVTLGNHEADLKPDKLQKRLLKLSKSCTVLNSNIGARTEAKLGFDRVSGSTKTSWLTSMLPPYSILHHFPRSGDKGYRIALLGLLTDELGVFRDGTFRGEPIQNVVDTYEHFYETLVRSATPTADLIIPITHETMHRDRELAGSILKTQGSGIIIGGHEHSPHDETITDSGSENFVRILKSGTEAEAVSVIDLDIEEEDGKAYIASVDYTLEEMKDYTNSVPVQQIVDSHMALLKSMENEEIVHANMLLPPGTLLSSERSRHKQTTVGGVICMALKEELEVDVALINGATIKGNKTYKDGNISYADLKKELPFPTKIVVVPMKRWELQEAIHYSRTFPEDADQTIPRKGFLQTDVEFDRVGFHTGDQDEVLQVALPRNLLKGFCDIKPLIALGDRLQEQNAMPGDDDFVPAIDVVISHFCKEKWYEIVHDQYSFSDLDRDRKGYLSRSDVKRMLRKAIGHEPPDFVVDDMVSAVDADDNGRIDPGEYSHLIAQLEREHGLIRFD